MQTVTDIIDRLGGTSAVAAALALTPSTVSSWKTSGRVPSWRRPGLISLAADLKIALTDADFRIPADASQAAA